jgi:L-lactate dehydrogenase
MKVSIIGGGGLVGSSAAFALQLGRIVREIALLDVNADLAAGQALDLLHGSPSTADQLITSGGYEHIPTSDVICITAGLRRKPDESRLDLINRNVDLFATILDSIAQSGLKKEAIVLVVSNPVDILTYLAAVRLELPRERVIGLGTQLDTIRFRSLIAAELGAPPTQVSASILGEHGDSMVPIWSSATVAGLPLEKYPGWSNNTANKLFERTKGSGAEVIRGKGGAGFAVGVAIADVIHRSHWIAAAYCRSPACRTALTEFAMWHSRCRRWLAAAGSSTAWKSNSGPRKCRASNAAGWCSARHWKRCSSA